MAKTFSPLFSMSASGRFADLLTFSMRKTGSQVRYQRKQKDRLTAPRIEQRVRFLLARDSWHGLDFGSGQYGDILLGGRHVDFSMLPKNKLSPQFSRYVGDYLLIFYP